MPQKKYVTYNLKAINADLKKVIDEREELRKRLATLRVQQHRLEKYIDQARIEEEQASDQS